jgi:hypothetical protein
MNRDDLKGIATWDELRECQRERRKKKRDGG